MRERTLIGLIILLLIGALIFLSYFLRPKFRERKISRLEEKVEELIKTGEFLDAEILLRRALKIAPADPEINFKLGEVLEKQGVLDQAQEYYLKSAKYGKTPQPLYQAGLAAYKMGKTDDARSFFEQNLIKYPNDLPTLYQLGWLFAREGKYEKALEYFERIVALKPDEAEAYNNLGYCLYNLDQPEKAQEMFERALQINPKLESARKSLKTIQEDLASPSLEPCAQCK